MCILFCKSFGAYAAVSDVLKTRAEEYQSFSKMQEQVIQKQKEK